MRRLNGITAFMDMSLSKLGSWWWTGKPGVLQSMGSQRVRHDWATELNWTELSTSYFKCFLTIQTHVHWVDDAIQPSRPLLFPSPPSSIFPSIRVFSKESVLHIRWPKYWNFSISPSNEYSGLISFRMDWLDLLAVQGTLKSLLQHHSSKASILRCSAFFPLVVRINYSNEYSKCFLAL